MTSNQVIKFGHFEEPGQECVLFFSTSPKHPTPIPKTRPFTVNDVLLPRTPCEAIVRTCPGAGPGVGLGGLSGAFGSDGGGGHCATGGAFWRTRLNGRTLGDGPDCLEGTRWLVFDVKRRVGWWLCYCGGFRLQAHEAFLSWLILFHHVPASSK